MYEAGWLGTDGHRAGTFLTQLPGSDDQRTPLSMHPPGPPAPPRRQGRYVLRESRQKGVAGPAQHRAVSCAVAASMEYTWRKKITGLSSNMGAVNGLWAAHPPALDHLSGDGVPLVWRRRRRGALSPFNTC